MNADVTFAQSFAHKPNFVHLWPDVLVTSLLALAGLFAGNLIMPALAIYAALMLVQDAHGIVARRIAHQRRSLRYEFGTGKLEQAANLAIAAVKIPTGLWLVYLVLADVHASSIVPTQTELGVCALVMALYTMRCANLAWVDQTSSVATFTPIGSSARTRLWVAAILQVAITFAVLAGDSVIAAAALSAGALVLALALLQSGIGQARAAVLDLVDHPLDAATEAQIQLVLGSLQLPDDQVVKIRARRAGGDLFAELTLASDPHRPLTETREYFADVRAKIEAGLPGTDVIIRLR